MLCLAHPVVASAAGADDGRPRSGAPLDVRAPVPTIGGMAITTSLRAQRFRSAWTEATAAGLGRYRSRRVRTSAYRTSDDMARELLRPVVD